MHGRAQWNMNFKFCIQKPNFICIKIVFSVLFSGRTNLSQTSGLRGLKRKKLWILHIFSHLMDISSSWICYCDPNIRFLRSSICFSPLKNPRVQWRSTCWKHVVILGVRILTLLYKKLKKLLAVQNKCKSDYKRFNLFP